MVNHSYDANGSETTVNGQVATYDFENHLVSLGSVANYVYDADGNRYSVASAGTTTSYVVDTSLPYASVVEEYSNGTLAARYDYGDDIVRMDRGSGVYYYLYDGLGSTRQLINTGGAVTDTWGYSAFGEMASHTGSTVNPFLFNAQQFDGASGDYYLRARYYDQSNGRFISQDPYGGSDYDPVSLHRYLYANLDPANRIDPSGEDTEGETLVANAGAATLSATLNSVIFNSGLLASRAVIFLAEHAIEIEFYASASAIAYIGVTSFVHKAIGLVIANNAPLVPDDPKTPNVHGDFLDSITHANSSNYQGLDDFRDGYATENKVYANFIGGDFETKLLKSVRKDAVELNQTNTFAPKDEFKSQGLPTYTTNNAESTLQVRGKAIFGAIPENYAYLLSKPEVIAELEQIDRDLDVAVTLAPLRGLRR